MATARFLMHRSNPKLFHHSYRNSFVEYNKVNAVRNKPVKSFTSKPRWRWQITLFATCCAFPWIVAFHHRSIPGMDKGVERLVGYLWHFEDKDNVDTFDKLPPVKTMYDQQLEQYDFDDSEFTKVREKPRSVRPPQTQ
mmetsp:Transcript_49137/g.78495  ORF Transcript_49137/g.78495 Transcript_49137/m.78495 type:complete len:138 (-) Transcript_49137:127-540(-)